MLIGLFAHLSTFIFVTRAEEQILKDFGKRLRSIRLRKNFTQEKLAFTIGMEISQISRIERGIINTSLLNIIKIAETLEVLPGELFGERT
ncbi:helix-turn-helix domain-containing protein [Niabella drilacis]|uniref:Helix-turn-helix domain-containing protein n=1 Tax=Niabella drilacis (strain DSM 25811 / CCM 8410 / CCUG 62505 / LMG 26954 / E90) TaxID=1285928 RepID=A0A1G6QGE1_NIADE|nr:helix-turn-helix transcriptional regulator [Niabella drilacis]SDC90715.1 Helix-turn-helix domain-containing protein [Niabella drilacis]